MRAQWGHQLGELSRVRQLIVDPVDQHILEGQAPTGCFTVFAARIKQFRNGMLTIDGHQIVTQIVVRRVQAHCQRDWQTKLG